MPQPSASSPPDASRPAILGGSAVRPEGPPGWPLRDDAILDALKSAWDSGDWGRYHGSQLSHLSEQLKRLLSVEHTILCASGTAAVELALRGLKVGPGDEVILSAYDFKGNFQNILTLGAVPVLVDVGERDWQIQVADLAAAITPRTKAILVSHLHGGMVAMPAVMEFAREHGLLVIEDACQMPGAIIGGQQAGTWGDIGVWSFGGSKLLTAGRGGLLFTNRDDAAQRVHLYTQRGNEAYPMSELQAAVLRPQLETLEQRNAIRTANANRLRELLLPIAGLHPFSESLTDSRPGYYKLGLQFGTASWQGLTRDQFAQAMRAEGIALDSGFRSLHRIHSARRFKTASSLREADRADEQALTLHHPILLTETVTDLEQIVAAIKKIQAHAAEIVRLKAN
ncbi:MAG: aminotransferase class V-fold PLP-dependent enzyme [Planctomycetota bacterium]